MNSNRKILYAFCLCILITFFGCIGFTTIDDYTWAEAFYMTIITVSTVGYGEVKPLSEGGRLFAALLILVGFGSLAFIGHALVESILEKIWDNKSGTKKMLKKISQLTSHYIICGYGRVGAAAAQQFIDAGVDFVIIEKSAEGCQRIRDEGYLFVEGDATNEDTLTKVGIKQAKGLLALLNQDPYNLFIVLSARELNPTLRIISRADHKSSEHKILQAGADTVMSPFKTAGRQIAEDVLLATGKHVSSDANQPQGVYTPEWIEVKKGSSMEGKTIGYLAKIMNRTILGHRHQGQDHILPVDTVQVKADDSLLIAELSTEFKIEPATNQVKPQKIVIIDDNPVIVRLYNRLFQKAGFHPIIADNGEDGLKMIIENKPTAAVIDYRLPNLSGIDVCRKVREEPSCQSCKLILFTSDNQKETKDMAIKAGADAVVVKSANAADIIETVVSILEKQ